MRASSSRALSLSSRLLPWQVAARLQRHECVGAVKQNVGGGRNCGTRTLDGDLPKKAQMKLFWSVGPPPLPTEKETPPQTTATYGHQHLG